MAGSQAILPLTQARSDFDLADLKSLSAAIKKGNEAGSPHADHLDMIIEFIKLFGPLLPLVSSAVRAAPRAATTPALPAAPATSHHSRRPSFIARWRTLVAAHPNHPQTTTGTAPSTSVSVASAT